MGSNMSVDDATLDDGSAATSSPARSKGRRSKGKAQLRVLGDLDQRTKSFRKVCDLISAIEGDLGGADRLSTGERQLVQRAALLGALAEDMEVRWLAGEEIDGAAYATLGNAQRRLFETIGLRRVPREVPSLQDYLAGKAAAADNSTK
jgi:hypothetical protein